MKTKGKKSNLSISRTTLYTQKNNFCMQFFFSKIVCLITKINLRLKKTQNTFRGNFENTLKNFCRRRQKNASHTFSIYGNCMISIFLTKSFSFLFTTIHRILCQNKRNVFRKFNDTILAKCMIFVWLVIFHRHSLWNCMISIFGLWRSTRLCVHDVIVLRVRVCMCLSECVSVSVCLYLRACVCYMSVWVFLCADVSLNVCVCVCVFEHLCVCECIINFKLNLKLF